VVEEEVPFAVADVLSIDDPKLTKEQKVEILVRLGRSMKTIDMSGTKDEVVAQYVYSIFMREHTQYNFSPMEMVLHYKDKQLQRMMTKFVDANAESVVLATQLEESLKVTSPRSYEKKNPAPVVESPI
jgi:hypothetical protein